MDVSLQPSGRLIIAKEGRRDEREREGERENCGTGLPGCDYRDEMGWGRVEVGGPQEVKGGGDEEEMGAVGVYGCGGLGVSSL